MYNEDVGFEVNNIFHANCIDIMSRMKDKSVDLVLTDPPYGIGLQYDTYEDTVENWFALMNQVLPEMRRVAKMVITPCCRIAALPWIYQNHQPDWLMSWYKGSTGHRSYVGFNDWEPHLVYGKSYSQLAMHDFFQTRPSEKKGTFNHPCPKPEDWAKWIISRATKPGMLVFDPFTGSGTVPVVCKMFGRKWIGCDISAEYVKIANDRVNNAQYCADIQNYQIVKNSK